MAAKTERITIRIGKDLLGVIDALVVVGEAENRSLAIRTAVREYVQNKMPKVELVRQKQQEQDQLRQLAATVRELREFGER